MITCSNINCQLFPNEGLPTPTRLLAKLYIHGEQCNNAANNHIQKRLAFHATFLHNKMVRPCLVTGNQK